MYDLSTFIFVNSQVACLMKITILAAPLLGRLVCVASLSACGGGGSGGSSGSAGVPAALPAGAWLTLKPSTLDLLAYEGEEVAIPLTGVSSNSFDKPFNMAIVDAVGVISPTVGVTADCAQQYRASMRSAATGALISKTRTTSRGGSWLAPTVVGNDVYTGTGDGGLVKFNAITTRPAWPSSCPCTAGRLPRSMPAMHMPTWRVACRCWTWPMAIWHSRWTSRC
jgi:hypothetical protein